MFADERRAKIIELLKVRQSLTVAELTKLFHVSIETIRRDMEYLEGIGSLRRVHGGAVSVKRMQNYIQLSERLSEHQKEKQVIAKTASAMIKEGDVIALDSGSTSLPLAQLLCERLDSLTVVTNSLEIFSVLSEKQSFNIILAGGYFYDRERAFYGHMTMDMIKQLHVSKYFLTPAAISIKFGLSDFVNEMISVQRTLIMQSSQIIVLADSSKFETEASYKICDLSSAYTYITDTGLPNEICRAYEEKGIHIEKY